MKVTHAETALKLVLWLGLFVLLIKQVYEQWLKFERRDTTIASSWDQESKLTFPDLIFCRKEAYKAPMDDLLAVKDFYKNFMDVDVELEYVKSATMPAQYPRMAQTFNLTTVFNGRCRVFHLGDKYTEMAWLKFSLRRNITYLVFFLARNQTFNLKTQNFRHMPKVTELSETTVVNIKPVKHILDKDSGCQTIPYNQSLCLMKSLETRLWEREISCAPEVFAASLNATRSCQSKAESKTFFDQHWDLVNELLTDKEACPESCTIESFDIQTVPSSVYSYGYSHDKFYLYIFFATSYVQVKSEYILMDLETFLSSMGGFVGLLLGLSSFSIGSYLINWGFYVAAKFSQVWV